VAFEAAARWVRFLGFGFYPRLGFIHVYSRPARQSLESFPVREYVNGTETLTARKMLADSRTMKGVERPMSRRLVLRASRSHRAS